MRGGARRAWLVAGGRGRSRLGASAVTCSDKYILTGANATATPRNAADSRHLRGPNRPKRAAQQVRDARRRVSAATAHKRGTPAPPCKSPRHVWNLLLRYSTSPVRSVESSAQFQSKCDDRASTCHAIPQQAGEMRTRGGWQGTFPRAARANARRLWATPHAGSSATTSGRSPP